MVKYALTCVLLLLTACTTNEPPQEKVQHEASSTQVLPMLHIQPEVYDLGDIKEGEAAIATFLIRNNSTKPIQLVDIQASCGCTAAEPDSYMINPGEFTQLKVAVDTSAKQFDIKKTVFVTDSLGNTAKALLVFNVVENPHAVMQGKVKGVFGGQCASCHFEPLVGVMTPDKLYEVGCAMCHGVDAAGAYAPSLQGMTSLAGLRHAIAHGVGKPQMPGFAEVNGGPLSYEQIEGLAEWLMALPKN